MSFWDSSALVAAFTNEPASPHVAHLMKSDPSVAIWWAAPVECASAAARRRREGVIGARGFETFLHSVREASLHWEVVEPLPAVRQAAIRLIRVHPLRAADAFQLAAALAWADGHPQSRRFVTLDSRLAEAARLEGFTVLPEEG